MITLKIVEEGDLPPKCGQASSKNERAMHCELLPLHGGDHYGRDRRGFWRYWKRKYGE